MTTKPRHEGAPGGPELARRIEALRLTPAFKARGLEGLADALGVSLATLYRWKAGEAKRISRAAARALVALEVEAGK